MNKYTEVIQKILGSEDGFGRAFCSLEAECKLTLSWGYAYKMSELTFDYGANKLSYLYLLSIVDQETADEMIELLKEPA